MRWGNELWDRFEDVSCFVYKGIEFCEKYEEFWKKRLNIENTYAKNLRKLIESFEPKKKESDEYQTTHTKCFIKMLGELRDVAGQHELVAENLNERVLVKINQIIKSLKEDRKKCIEEKEKYYQEHINSNEQLEKCKLKYERAFKEVEKAEELLTKVENDDSASKNDIRKQKTICEQKKKIFDTFEAEYGKQLCEANKIKNNYYYEQLPTIFDDLQNIEKKRIDYFKSLVKDCVNIEVEVLPRIMQCYKEIEVSLQQIDIDKDNEIVIKIYKTGYSIPTDHIFENLTDKSINGLSKNELNQSITNQSSHQNILTNTINTIKNASSNFANNSNTNNQVLNIGLSSSNISNNANRQKKYRTLNKIKGLFSASKNENELLLELPPQQLKNELVKKIKLTENEIEKQQKEKEGLIKLKDIYSKNQRFGDSQSADLALKANEEKLAHLKTQLKKYQDLCNQIDPSMNNQLSIAKQENQYFSTGYCLTNVVSDGNSEFKTDRSNFNINDLNSLSALKQSSDSNKFLDNILSKNNENHNLSLPSTPNSNHSNTTHSSNPNNIPYYSSNCNQNTVAYAISSLNHINKNLNYSVAPLVNKNNNESFENEDEEDQDIDYEENCYEIPNVNIKLPNNVKLSNLVKDIVKNDIDDINDKCDNIEIDEKIIIATKNEKLQNKSQDFCRQQYDLIDANVYGKGLHTEINDQYCQQIENELVIGTALVMYSFEGTVQNAMSIEENESLNVLERDSGDGWTLVKRLNGEKGYVPTDYIRIVFY